MDFQNHLTVSFLAIRHSGKGSREQIKQRLE